MNTRSNRSSTTALVCVLALVLPPELVITTTAAVSIRADNDGAEADASEAAAGGTTDASRAAGNRA